MTLFRAQVLLIAAVLAVALWFAFAPRASAPAASISGLRAEMLAAIERDGATAAYENFKNAYANQPFDVQHNAAHLFGESLFGALGVPGVTVCDTDFNFGCYHGFFTAAVGTAGLDVVSELDQACGDPTKGTGSACQHGIGHGILEYLGHDRLDDALAACGRTRQPDPLAGCTSGVFMEYNVPLIVNGDGTYAVATRPLADPADPYAPCPDLATGAFRQSCYFELGQWWGQLYGRDDFGKLGRLCTAVADERERSACFDGISKIVPSTAGYDAAKSRALCETMPGGAAVDRCVVQASWTFEQNTHSHAEALALCATASPAARSGCPS